MAVANCPPQLRLDDKVIEPEDYSLSPMMAGGVQAVAPYKASGVVALVIVGAVGRWRRQQRRTGNPIFEFPPFFRLRGFSKWKLRQWKEGVGAAARVWMASVPWVARKERGAISGFLFPPLPAPYGPARASLDPLCC